MLLWGLTLSSQLDAPDNEQMIIEKGHNMLFCSQEGETTPHVEFMLKNTMYKRLFYYITVYISVLIIN